MPKNTNRKEILESLRTRFLDEGEKLTVKEIVDDYFTPNSPYAYLVAENTVRGILASVKRWLRKEHGLWFGNIDDQGHYGLFTDEAEARYGMVRYYRFVKGVFHNANILASNAREKGLLPGGTREVRLRLSVPLGEDNGLEEGEEKKERGKNK